MKIIPTPFGLILSDCTRYKVCRNLSVGVVSSSPGQQIPRTLCVAFTFVVLHELGWPRSRKTPVARKVDEFPSWYVRKSLWEGISIRFGDVAPWTKRPTELQGQTEKGLRAGKGGGGGGGCRRERERKGAARRVVRRSLESLSQPFFRPKSFFPSSRTITRQIQSNAGSNRIPFYRNFRQHNFNGGGSEREREVGGNTGLEAEWTTRRDRR